MPSPSDRYCRSCGGRLARDQDGTECTPCHRTRTLGRAGPPEMPAGFWRTDGMRDVMATWHMGKVLRAYRHHPHHGIRALSQEVVGRWLGLSQAQLSRLETGPPLKDLGRLTHYARTLHIPADLLWFQLPDEPPAFHEGAMASDSPESSDTSTGGVLLPVVVNGRSVLVPLDAETLAASGLAEHVGVLASAGGPDTAWDIVSLVKRQSLLSGGIAAAALPAFGLEEVRRVAAALEDARRYFDGSVVEYFQRQLEASKAEDGQRGPRKTLPMVLAILSSIEEHGREVRPAVRRQLLSVGANGAEFAGWLYRDIRQPLVAAYWHDRATEWAQEAGDLPMQGYVLLKKSQMAYDERDALRVLTLAQAAKQGPWNLPGRVRAEVAQQEALGLAMLGEPMPGVEQRLDDARQLLAQVSWDDESTLGAYYTDTTLLLRNASSYSEAGRPARAAALFGEIIAKRDLSRRDQGYFQSRRAIALALSGEPDEAATVSLRSLPIATATSSQRTIRVLSEVVRTLRPWQSRPVVRTFRDAFQTAAARQATNQPSATP